MIRFSRSWLWVTARAVCRRKTDRSKTSRLSPVRTSPALSAVRPGIGRPVAWYTAEKSPMGTPPAEVRRSRITAPWCSHSSRPSMGLPFQGR